MEYIILIVFSFTLFLISKKLNTLIFKQSNNILIDIFIFSYFFVFIYLIFSYLFIIEIDGKIISYLIFFGLVFSTIVLRIDILNLLKKIKFKVISNNKIIFFVLILYFLLILFPAFDEDSLRYHLAVAKKINNNSFYENTWIDYLIIGAHEFINSFSLHLKFEEISAYTNFIYLLFILLSNIYILKKYKTGSGVLSFYILIASPYLLSLLSSQKLYLLPCFIVTYSLAYLFLEKKKINLKIYLLLLFLNIFCVIIKPTFLPYLCILGLWSIYRLDNLNNKIIYISCGLLFSIISYFPLFITKFNIYNDPFLVFFSINENNYSWFYEYRNFLSNIRMDYTDIFINNYLKNILIPLKLIIPIQYSDVSRTLGLGLLFLFTINFKKNKNIKYLILLFIISVILLQSFQSRWFLPLLIFTSIFANVVKLKLLFKFLKLQVLLLILVLTPLSILTFLMSFKIVDKKIVLYELLNSHLQVVDKLNDDYKDQNIFTNLNDFYNLENFVPVYYPNIVVQYDKNFYRRNEKDTKYILWIDRNSSYRIEEFIDQNLTCKKYQKIDEFIYNSRRLFLFSSDTKVVLYKLGC